MAGSYNHVITKGGNLRDNESFVQMIENLGDAYEAVEEMFGMIWWLAWQAHVALDGSAKSPEHFVERARQNYEEGLKIAKRTKNKRRHDS